MSPAAAFLSWLEHIPAPSLPKLRVHARALRQPAKHPDGPAPAPLPGAGPLRHESRMAPRGKHHAGSMRVHLGTGTLPRLQVEGRPPWNTQPMPKLTEGRWMA